MKNNTRNWLDCRILHQIYPRPRSCWSLREVIKPPWKFLATNMRQFCNPSRAFVFWTVSISLFKQTNTIRNKTLLKIVLPQTNAFFILSILTCLECWNVTVNTEISKFVCNITSMSIGSLLKSHPIVSFWYYIWMHGYFTGKDCICVCLHIHLNIRTHHAWPAALIIKQLTYIRKHILQTTNTLYSK